MSKEIAEQIAELNAKITARKDIIAHIQAGMYLDYVETMLLNIGDTDTIDKLRDATKPKLIEILEEVNQRDKNTIIQYVKGGDNE